MNYRQIIGDAWNFTQENKKLIVWYAFIPSFLTTAFGVLYLIYQFYAFKSSPLFENWSESFTVLALKDTFQVLSDNKEFLVPFLIIAGILTLLYFFLPPIAEGAMIQLIARKKNEQDVRIRDGLQYGLFTFLPFFSYSLVEKTYSLYSIPGEMSFVIRSEYLGIQVFDLLIPIFILIAIISVLFQFMFIFSQYYIVIDNNNIHESMAKSAVLAFKHFNTTIKISFFMFLIGIRIILQIIFVLLIPGILLLGTYYFTSTILPDFGLYIGGALGVVALFLASYLGAIVHVFTTTVWVFTFLDLTNMPEISAREKT